MSHETYMLPVAHIRKQCGEAERRYKKNCLAVATMQMVLNAGWPTPLNQKPPLKTQRPTTHSYHRRGPDERTYQIPAKTMRVNP